MKSLLAGLLVLSLFPACVFPGPSLNRTAHEAYGPHLSLVPQDGDFVYRRDDGRTYPFSTRGLEDAVRDNPAALASARQYRRQRIAGWAMALGGGAASIGASVGGIALVEHDHDTAAGLLGGLAVACLLVEMFGGVTLYRSERYRVEAFDLANAGPTWGAPPVPPEASQVTLPGQRKK
jgi:hypothetical protein